MLTDVTVLTPQPGTAKGQNMTAQAVTTDEIPYRYSSVAPMHHELHAS